MEAPWLTQPKKANTVESAGKVMDSVVWDADNIYAKGTNTGTYASLLMHQIQKRQNTQ